MNTSNLVRCLFSGALTVLLLSACAGKPLVPYSTDTEPLVLLPANQAGVADDRARFREIFCAVMGDHGQDLPDYRPSEEALVRVGDEPQAGGSPVYLGSSQSDLLVATVPGLGWDCFEEWLKSERVVAVVSIAGAVGGSLGDGRAYRPFARIYGFDRN